MTILQDHSLVLATQPGWTATGFRESRLLRWQSGFVGRPTCKG